MVNSIDKTGPGIWRFFVFSSLLYFYSYSEADNDLWGHLLFGRLLLNLRTLPAQDPFSFTAGSSEWLNHEWLVQIIFVSAWEVGGSPLLLGLKFAVALLTFALLYAAIIKKGENTVPQLSAALFVLFIAVTARGFPIRPQIVTYLGVAYVIYVIECIRAQRHDKAWPLPFFFLFWANCHAGVAAGLGAFFVFAVSQISARQKNWKLTCALWILSALATLVNPYGVYLYSFLINELSSPHPITEWQPISLDAEHAPFLVMAGLAFVTLPFNRQWRERPWENVLMLLTALMAIRHQRHTPLFALFALLPLTHQVHRMHLALKSTGRLPKLSPAAHAVIATSVTFIAIVQISFSVIRLKDDGFQITYDPRDYPAQTVAILQNLPGQSRINLAAPLEWGEYLLWSLYPKIRVSLDGRFAALYSPQIVRANFELFYSESNTNELLEKHDVEAILAPHDAACRPCRDGGYRKIFQDSVSALFVKEGGSVESAVRRALEQRPHPFARILTAGGGYSELLGGAE